MQLVDYRNSQKKTQQQCADELDIRVQYYSDIERKYTKCGRKTAEKIVEWSNKKVTFSDLWDWDIASNE